MSINEVSWVHELAQRFLAHQDVLVHPPLDVVMCALSSAGMGLDHSVGEEMLAFSDHSAPVNGKPVRLRQYFAVTDRRLVAADLAVEARWAVPYRDMQHVEAGDREVAVYAYGQRHVLATPVAGALGAMLVQLIQMAPQHREPPPRPLSQTSASDPTGAWTAASWMDGRETRLALLLQYIYGAQKRQAMYGSVGADLVARITLAYRNDRGGRGMANGCWMSPLSASDLSDGFAALYGHPVAVTETGATHAAPEVGIRPGASVSHAAGVLSAVVVGVGWQDRRPYVAPRFKLQVGDSGSYASFALLDEHGHALSATSPALLMAIHKALLNIERDVVLRRTVLGWELPFGELLSVDPGYLDAQLGTRLGKTA